VEADQQRTAFADHRRAVVAGRAFEIAGRSFVGGHDGQTLAAGDDHRIGGGEQGLGFGVAQRSFAAGSFLGDSGASALEHLTGAVAAGSARTGVEQVDGGHFFLLEWASDLDSIVP